MRLFGFIALQTIIVFSVKTKESPKINNEQKEKRFVESNNDGKNNPTLWMIFNQLDKMQSKMAKMEDEISKINDVVSKLQNSKGGFDKPTQLNNKITGSTYVQWGKLKCSGTNTDTVYKGQAAGGHYTHPGSGVNYLCLPDDPNIGKKLPSSSYYDLLYGAEYELFNHNKPVGLKSGLTDHDVPCAVCIAKGKTTTLMIPGRKNCYKGWKREYDGYLMSGHYVFEGAGEYVCVDKRPEVLNGGHANHNGKLFYPVKTVCGSLHCPPYKQDGEVLCVVCSK